MYVPQKPNRMLFNVQKSKQSRMMESIFLAPSVDRECSIPQISCFLLFSTKGALGTPKDFARLVLSFSADFANLTMYESVANHMVSLKLRNFWHQNTKDRTVLITSFFGIGPNGRFSSLGLSRWFKQAVNGEIHRSRPQVCCLSKTSLFFFHSLKAGLAFQVDPLRYVSSPIIGFVARRSPKNLHKLQKIQLFECISRQWLIFILVKLLCSLGNPQSYKTRSARRRTWCRTTHRQHGPQAWYGFKSLFFSLGIVQILCAQYRLRTPPFREVKFIGCNTQRSKDMEDFGYILRKYETPFTAEYTCSQSGPWVVEQMECQIADASSRILHPAHI